MTSFNCSVFPFFFSEIFDRANTYNKDSTPELKEERAMLLEDWLNMETGFGKLGDVRVVQSKLPKKVKKRKLSSREDGCTEYALHTYNFLICYLWNVRIEM